MMKNSAGASGGLNTFYFHVHKEGFAAVSKIAPNNRQMKSLLQKVQGPKKVEILVKNNNLRLLSEEKSFNLYD